MSPQAHTRLRLRIEGMFQRSASVLHSEIKTLGHPRGALRGCTVGPTTRCRCCKALSSRRNVRKAPTLDVTTYHLAEHVKSGYKGMLIAAPAGHWPTIAIAGPNHTVGGPDTTCTWHVILKLS